MRAHACVSTLVVMLFSIRAPLPDMGLLERRSTEERQSVQRLAVGDGRPALGLVGPLHVVPVRHRGAPEH